jgi:hypothetical protein
MTIAALAVDGQETAPVCALSGPRVLVVEDDPEVVALVNKLLR